MKTRKSFLLRLDPALYQELEEWSQQEMRSVNGQIEFLLRQAAARRKGREPPDDAQGEQPSRHPP
jgi:hypothetical protein